MTKKMSFQWVLLLRVCVGLPQTNSVHTTTYWAGLCTNTSITNVNAEQPQNKTIGPNAKTDS